MIRIIIRETGAMIQYAFGGISFSIPGIQGMNNKRVKTAIINGAVIQAKMIQPFDSLNSII
jgi:hypothetical protein